MRRSFIMEFCPKNVPKVNLLTRPKFNFKITNGTGVIKKLFAGVSDHPPSPPTPPLYNLERLEMKFSKIYFL